MKPNRMIVVAAWLLLLALMVMPAGAQDGGFDLTVLHTNDVHARVDEFDSGGNTCDQEERDAGECWGGVARRKTVIDQVRAEVENVLLLDGGDQFQGTLFFNRYKGAEAQEMMNELGYDAMTIGNHEFDDGPGTFGSFLRGINFPVVAANVDASAEPELAGLIEPYVVLEVSGQQIGVVGFTTEDTAILSSPGPDVAFNNIEESVQAAVDELTAQGVNKIIGVSHAGYIRDQEVAAAIDGIDIIVGGHSHTVLSNTDPDAAGPYPTVVDGPGGSPVLVISNGSYGRTLGRLNVSFNEEGVITEYSGEPILLDSSVAQDEAIQARVQELAQPLNELMTQVIGAATVDLDGERDTCRHGECTMGNLIADAILWKTQSEGTDIVITNGGGIRASIPAGDVTVGDVLTVLPFGNLIATFELTGAEVVEALEHGVGRAENPENEGTGRFPQVAGLRYTWDPTQPAGSRIASVEVGTAETGYSPIDPDAAYQVASNDFMRTGGDGYEVFVTARNPYDFGPSLDQAVQEYIAANSPVAPELEGRITTVDGAAPMTGAPEEAEEEMAEEAPAAAPAESALCAQEYTVQADDWLSRIAERTLGDVLAYTAIAEATQQARAQDDTFANITDPNVIEIGWKLCIPAPETGAEDSMEDSVDDSAQDGAEDGAQEGTEDGTEDGAQEGTEEGTEDGAQEDTQDGAQEGTEDGTEDGAQEGTQDGTEDGAQEGTQDGTEDGAQEGTEEGAQDGTEDGTQDSAE